MGFSIDEAREQGRQAAQDMRPVTANPYSANTARELRAEWLAGWQEEKVAQRRREG